ncbi:MAG: DUF456 domain-containing protein [Bacteroidales bacterium]|jgi:uncharacterized protein YqgC (DUF456 family)|nr:DUF456 domain-containing protein [Bacteroidales bacterium]
MILDILLLVAGGCFLLLGLIGCILPAIPGPPISYVALLLLQATRFGDFSLRFLLTGAFVTLAITVFDYIVPVWSTKKWGGSRAGTAGAMIGLIAGLFFPPAGIIIGPFLGAVVGELTTGRDSNAALKSGFGAFVGFLIGTGCKLAVSLVFTWYFIKELIFKIN